MARRTAAAAPAQKPKEKTNFTKFVVGSDPLEKETKIEDIEPLSGEQTKRMLQVAEIMSQTKGLTPEEINALKVWKMNLAAEGIEGFVKAEFLKDFWAWLLGRGKEADHKKTSWYRQSLADDPEVRAYVDMFPKKKMEYDLKLEFLKFRRPIGIAQVYLYFKYIVRGKSTSSDFLDDWAVFLQEFDEARNTGQYYVDQEEFPHPHETAPYGDLRRDFAKRRNKGTSIGPALLKGAVAGDDSSDEDDSSPRPPRGGGGGSGGGGGGGGGSNTRRVSDSEDDESSDDIVTRATVATGAAISSAASTAGERFKSGVSAAGSAAASGTASFASRLQAGIGSLLGRVADLTKSIFEEDDLAEKGEKIPEKAAEATVSSAELNAANLEDMRRRLARIREVLPEPPVTAPATTSATAPAAAADNVPKGKEEATAADMTNLPVPLTPLRNAALSPPLSARREPETPSSRATAPPPATPTANRVIGDDGDFDDDDATASPRNKDFEEANLRYRMEQLKKKGNLSPAAEEDLDDLIESLPDEPADATKRRGPAKTLFEDAKEAEAESESSKARTVSRRLDKLRGGKPTVLEEGELAPLRVTAEDKYDMIVAENLASIPPTPESYKSASSAQKRRQDQILREQYGVDPEAEKKAKDIPRSGKKLTKEQRKLLRNVDALRAAKLKMLKAPAIRTRAMEAADILESLHRYVDESGRPIGIGEGGEPMSDDMLKIGQGVINAVNKLERQTDDIEKELAKSKERREKIDRLIAEDEAREAEDDAEFTKGVDTLRKPVDPKTKAEATRKVVNSTRKMASNVAENLKSGIPPDDAVTAAMQNRLDNLKSVVKPSTPRSAEELDDIFDDGELELATDELEIIFGEATGKSKPITVDPVSPPTAGDFAALGKEKATTLFTTKDKADKAQEHATTVIATTPPPPTGAYATPGVKGVCGVVIRDTETAVKPVQKATKKHQNSARNVVLIGGNLAKVKRRQKLTETRKNATPANHPDEERRDSEHAEVSSEAAAAEEDFAVAIEVENNDRAELEKTAKYAEKKVRRVRKDGVDRLERLGERAETASNKLDQHNQQIEQLRADAENRRQRSRALVMTEDNGNVKLHEQRMKEIDDWEAKAIAAANEKFHAYLESTPIYQKLWSSAASLSEINNAELSARIGRWKEETERAGDELLFGPVLGEEDEDDSGATEEQVRAPKPEPKPESKPEPPPKFPSIEEDISDPSHFPSISDEENLESKPKVQKTEVSAAEPSITATEEPHVTPGTGPESVETESEMIKIAPGTSGAEVAEKLEEELDEELEIELSSDTETEQARELIHERSSPEGSEDDDAERGAKFARADEETPGTAAKEESATASEEPRAKKNKK